jgi:hypothetical protein
MNKTNHISGPIQFILCFALVTILSGCIGVEGPGYVGPPGVVDVGVFGGGGHYDHGHDRDFSRRGAASRGGSHDRGGHR